MELVPDRYRQLLDVTAMAGVDTVLLKGGHIEIIGCQTLGVVTVEDGLALRGVRADAPWILGSLRHPPCLVLDPGALRLQFSRRASVD
jgi:hypothetical protein